MTAPLRVRRGCSPLALLGCGCGLLAGVGIIFVFLILGVQYVHARKDPVTWNRQSYAQCQHNLAYLRLSLDRYRADHQQQLPERLEQMNPVYIDSALRLRCPLEMQERGVRYRYTPDSAQPTDPLITCPNHGQGAIVLQHNGRIRLPNIQRK